MFLWMLKYYTSRNNKLEDGKSRYLVYESTSFDGQSGFMEGNWFYHGFEADPQFRGKWRLALQ